MENETVKLCWSDGSVSDEMPRDRAAFIVAFTLSGDRPKIIERDKWDESGRERTR